MSELRLNWKEPGPVAGAFFRDKAFVSSIMGPIGSGKSTACVFKALNKLKLQPPGTRSKMRRRRVAVIRNTYPELRTTTIRTWHEWVPENYGNWQGEGPPTHTVQFNLDGSVAELEMVFLALDRPEDMRKLLSFELSDAWINEAREVPPEILSHLQGRVGRFPPANDGGCAEPQIWLDSNPPPSEHWWFELFEERKPDGFKIFKQPSGRSPLAENLSNLPAGYYERAMMGQDEAWIRVYVDGLYGFSRDGHPVFPEFSDSLHVAAQPLRVDEGLTLTIGLDAGMTPAAILKQRRPNGQWRSLAEVVPGRAGPLRFAECLSDAIATVAPNHKRDRIECFADPSSDYGADKEFGERSWMEIMSERTGLLIQPAATNEIHVRLEAIRQGFVQMIDGREPGYLISPACKILRRAYNNGYRYKRIQTSGGVRVEDKPDKNEFSHPADADQYGALGKTGLVALKGRQAAAANFNRQGTMNVRIAV